MPFPVLPDKPLPVKFLPDPAEAIRDEFPNRLAVGDNLQRQSGPLTSMPLVRQEFLSREFDSLARESGMEPVLKQVRRRTPANPVVETLEGMVNGIIEGRSLEPERESIRRFVSNQEERAKIVSHLLLTHDVQRLVKMLQTRDQIEQQLHEAAHREDLNPSERLAYMGMLTTEIDRATGRVRAKAANPEDLEALLEKADFKLQADEATLIAKHSEGTSTVGRELMRRLGYKLQKMASAMK